MRATIAMLIGAVSLCGLLPQPAAASYCDEACEVYRCRSEQTQLEEQRALAESGALDGVDWAVLVSALSHRAACQARVAVWDSRSDWQPQAALERGPEKLAAAARAEQRHWLQLAVNRPAASPELWRQLAEAQDGAAERLAILRLAHESDLASAPLVTLLGEELRAQERWSEAESLLRGYLDKHPDAGVSSLLARILDGRGAQAEARHLLEEQARRLPEDAASHAAVLGAYVDAGMAAEAAAYLAAVEPHFSRAADRALLCSAVGPRDSPQRVDCYGRVLALAGNAGGDSAADPSGFRTDDQNSRWRAREELVDAALERQNWPQIETVIAGAPAGEQVELWSLLPPASAAQWCPAFLAAYRGGTLTSFATARAPKNGWWEVELAARLRDCGAAAEAQQLRAHAIASAPLESLSALPSTEMIPALLRRVQLDPDDRAAQQMLRGRMRSISLAEGKNLLVAVAQILKTDSDPVRHLAALEAAAEHQDTAMHLWQEAFRRQPADLNLLVQVGRAALLSDNTTAAASAGQRLVAAPQASPRQQAEGHYLLGRVAQLGGNLQQAVDEMTPYFLGRLRFAGCGGPRGVGRDLTCDEPLVALLLQLNDPQRLARYWQSRASAIAAYVRLVESNDFLAVRWADTERQLAIARGRSPRQRPLMGACGALAASRLPVLPATRPPLAEGTPDCPAAELGREVHFEDDTLLFRAELLNP
jgi:hypothetical protein